MKELTKENFEQLSTEKQNLIEEKEKLSDANSQLSNNNIIISMKHDQLKKNLQNVTVQKEQIHICVYKNRKDPASLDKNRCEGQTQPQYNMSGFNTDGIGDLSAAAFLPDKKEPNISKTESTRFLQTEEDKSLNSDMNDLK